MTDANLSAEEKLVLQKDQTRVAREAYDRLFVECQRLKLERTELIEALDLAIFALEGSRDDGDHVLSSLKKFLARVTK